MRWKKQKQKKNHDAPFIAHTHTQQNQIHREKKRSFASKEAEKKTTIQWLNERVSKNIMQLKTVPVQIRSLTSIHNFIAMNPSNSFTLTQSDNCQLRSLYSKSVRCSFICSFFFYSSCSFYRRNTRNVLQVLSIWSTYK